MKQFVKTQVAPFLLGSFLSVLLLTAGWERFPSFAYNPVDCDFVPAFSLEERKVVVLARAITGQESKLYFGHDLISRGVQPLHMTIQNNTAEEYSLSPSSVDQERIDPRKIAFKVTRSTIPRAIFYKVAGLLFWPFAIPGMIDGIRVMKHHQWLKKEVKGKAMRDEIVAPYATVHRILFVPLDRFESSFKVTLIELGSLKRSEFQVDTEIPAPVEVLSP